MKDSLQRRLVFSHFWSYFLFLKMENSEFSKTVYKDEWFCHLQIKKMENFERVHKEDWCSVIFGAIFYS